MEDEAIGGFGSQQKRNSSENQPATNSTVPFKQPNTASSTHLNGSSVQGPHQPSRLGPSIPNPRLNGPPLTDPSKVKMMLSPTGSAGKPQLGVNRPSMMSPPAVSAPSQNAGSSPILPSTPAIPASSQYADRPAVPTPPPVPPIQEMERSLPISTPSQPKNAPTVSVIQPPAHGIKNDLSGSISYAVGDSSAPHTLPGATSMKPTPGHSPLLFCSDSVVPSSTMSLDKRVQSNNASALSTSTSGPRSPGSPPPNRPLTKPSRFNSPGPKPKNSPPPVPDHPPCSNSQKPSPPIPPPPSSIPAPTQNADSTTVPPPPPVPQAGTQEMELSLPMPTSSQPKNALTVSVIQPPAHGIKNDPSGPTAYTVGDSSAPHALPGATSMNPKPGNSPLFCSNSAVPSSIMSRGKELSLNQNNIHSQPSNAPDGSTLLPPPPPVPPVGAEIGQAENQKSSNLPLEDPTLIDRHNLSESLVPTAPKLLPSHSNGNTNELDTQTSADGNNADGSNGEVSNEDSSKSDDDTLSDNSNSKSSCGPGCTCY